MSGWKPTEEQTAAARRRVGATWARLLAERHPGHRFVVEWREGPAGFDATPLPRKVVREVVDEQKRRPAA